MWRVIGLNVYQAFENMAIDEAVGECVASGASQPTIRFYKWSYPGSVSIGRFQCIADEVDLAKCKELGVDCVRRVTGGGAVFHDPEGEITYSVIAPARYFSRGIPESYREICSYIIDALSGLGICAGFRPVNDVVVGGKKISGSAQTRRNGIIIQHGTILYKLDRNTMFSLLKPSRLKLSDKAFGNFEDGLTRVREENGVSIAQLYAALLDGFTEDKEYRFGELSEYERELSMRLGEKYLGREWNFSR